MLWQTEQYRTCVDLLACASLFALLCYRLLEMAGETHTGVSHAPGFGGQAFLNGFVVD